MRTETTAADDPRDCAEGSNARRHWFWAGVRGVVMSVPAGVFLRLGG